MRPIFLPFFASILAACGGTTTAAPANVADADTSETIADTGAAPAETGDDSAVDTDNGMPSSVYPAPHPPLPQLVNQGMGAILNKPKVFLIFYPSYPFAPQMQTLAKAMGASSYWSAAVSEYGVGPITYVDSKELTGETAPASISDKEVEAFLNGKIAAGAFGTPDRDTIYTIFYPSSTVITTSGGFTGPSKSCQSFGGYHSDTTVTVSGTAANYAFAVLPTCTSFSGLAGIDALSGALSHEWAEAATDPFPSTNMGADAAYSGVDADHVIWNLLGGAENGDLCAQRKDTFFKPMGLDFTLQATWSNAAAKKGGDPCMPKSPAVYFNSVPVMNENVKLDLSALGGGLIPTKGLKIKSGESKTVEVDLFSDGDTKGPWKVTAIDALARFTMKAPTLDFTWDRDSGQNGERLHLTIKVIGASPFGKAHPFFIASTKGMAQQLWPALVTE